MLERLSSELRDRLRQLTLDLAGPRRAALEALPKPPTEFGVDPFGFDPDFALSAVAPFVWLYKNYFRVEAHGVEKVPSGRALLVGNQCMVCHRIWDAGGSSGPDLTDYAMREVRACREAHAGEYVKVSAYDRSLGRQTTALSFIVNRPADEPGFRLERQEKADRQVRYTLSAYAADRPRGRRYAAGQNGDGGP